MIKFFKLIFKIVAVLIILLVATLVYFIATDDRTDEQKAIDSAKRNAAIQKAEQERPVREAAELLAEQQKAKQEAIAEEEKAIRKATEQEAIYARAIKVEIANKKEKELKSIQQLERGVGKKAARSTSLPANLSRGEQYAYCAGVFSGAGRLDTKFTAKWDQKADEAMLKAMTVTGQIEPTYKRLAFDGIDHVTRDNTITSVAVTCGLMMPATIK